MKFYEDVEKSLLEAIEIGKNNIKVEKREDMPASTFFASEKERKLIDQIVSIRKGQNMSQGKLAELTGNKQQAISRTEKKEHSPSLKMFCNIVNALGYDLQIVKLDS